MSIQFLDRAIRLPASPEQVSSRFEFDHWMMTDAERSSLTALLQELKPECAIEIGTYRAGSLAVLAKYSKQVYSLDIDPSCRENYADEFANVEFVTGPSDSMLPAVLEKIESSGQALNFVLIDGAHTEDGVRNDLNALLRYIPKAPLYIVMHDSFNPGCRKGIRTADWASNPHAHLLELDYVHGRLMPRDEGASYREMWCGFALGVLLPEPRSGEFLVHENESIGYLSSYWFSRHPYTKLRTPVHKLRVRLGRWRRQLMGRSVPS